MVCWLGWYMWIIVSLTGGFRLFGVLLVLVVLVVLARGLHPVSFPNLEVKPFCADGTATGGLWESRALPTVFLCGGGVWSCCGVGAPTTFLFVVLKIGLCRGVLDFLTHPYFYVPNLSAVTVDFYDLKAA